MTKFLKALLLCIGLAAVISARGETDSATAEMLMRKSGLWQQLSEAATQVRAGVSAALEQSPTKASDQEVARLSNVISAAYSADRLRSIALGTIARNLDAKQVPALQSWFGTRVGKTVTQLEEKAAADGRAPEVLIREGVALLKDLSPARRQLMDVLVVTTRSAEVLANLSIKAALAAYQGATSIAAPSAGAPSLDELRKSLEAQRPQMQQAFALISLASFVWTYDPLPTTDLEQYVSFLKSEPGMHFNEVSILALDAAMVAASTDLGRGAASTPAAKL